MQLKQALIQQIHGIVASAKERAIRSVDTERVLMYWHIGRVIFEEEQEGKERAAYGEFLCSAPQYLHNNRKPHQALHYKTPSSVFFAAGNPATFSLHR